MEDNRTGSARPLQRCFEGHRLEEQLWSIAYEQIWPVLRKSLNVSVEARRTRRGKTGTKKVARRA
jgi:hypothetical protein